MQGNGKNWSIWLGVITYQITLLSTWSKKQNLGTLGKQILMAHSIRVLVSLTHTHGSSAHQWLRRGEHCDCEWGFAELFAAGRLRSSSARRRSLQKRKIIPHNKIRAAAHSWAGYSARRLHYVLLRLIEMRAYCEWERERSRRMQ